MPTKPALESQAPDGAMPATRINASSRFCATTGPAKWLLPLLLLSALTIAPFIGAGSAFMLSLLARAMILAIAALGLSMLVGGAGLASLGQAAMLGIGAYSVAILDLNGITEGAAVFPVAILAGGLFAFLTGLVVLRTNGIAFIMITLAFGQMTYFLASSVSSLGGDDGYTLYGRTLLFGSKVLRDRLVFYFVCLGTMATVWMILAALLESRFGRVLRAARQNPIRVQALGLSPYPFRLLAYTVSGAVAGLAGGLLANATAFVSPAALSWGRSAELLFMVILGGSGRLAGAVIGALVMVLLEEILAENLTYWRLLYGPLLVAIVLIRGGEFGRRKRHA